MGHTELRLADVSAFLGVLRVGSITGAARGLEVTASQVSKAVVRLEDHFKVKLLLRSASGARVSDDGRRMAPAFEELLERVRTLDAPGSRAELTMVAAAFLNAFFLPRLVARLPEVRLHSLDLPPGIASTSASESLFDLALTIGSERFPSSWTRAKVGTIERALFASREGARRLGPRVTVEKLRSASFIGPIYGFRGQAIPGDDGCPLPARERTFGHRTQTVALALALAESSDQLVFAPTLAARDLCERGRLVEIPVEGWSVREPLHLVCHEERVPAPLRRKLLTALRAAL